MTDGQPLGERMPFSTLRDPADVARAHAALDRAWDIVKQTVRVGYEASERERLAYIVAAMALAADDEDDLTHRAVEKFRSRP